MTIKSIKISTYPYVVVVELEARFLLFLIKTDKNLKPSSIGSVLLSPANNQHKL